MMTAHEFLDRFSQYADSDIHSLRRTPLLDQFPTDPRVYTQIATSFFADRNIDWERRSRLVSILCEFLYHDGRTFDALLCIVEKALGEPDYVCNGINSLAGVWCYLNMDRPASMGDEELLANFRRYAENAELLHNAKNCCELILRRRPDLLDI
ncbi:MAG TPA: hypothetical protein VHV08_03605 [Pirellulales bacterium]|jgi:hypothetical protein|nr:hypothetical protein [Pirellulales bacterium]